MKLSLTSFLSSRSQSAYTYAFKNFFSSSGSSLRWSNEGRSLYKRISPIGDRNTSIVPVLDKWIEEGRKADEVDLQYIIKELNFYKRFTHALEVSRWMTEKRYIAPSSDDVSFRLRFIYKVHGLEQAENYFNNIPQQLKGYQVYASLLNCYCLSKSIEKAESTMQKIRDLGYNRTSLSYSILMKLYYHVGDFEKLDPLMQEMEEKNIRLDKFTYTIRLSAYATVSDSEGIDQIVKRMESDPRVAMDTSAYAIAARGYMKLRLVDKALEILKKLEGMLLTSSSRRRNFTFDFIIELYGEMGKKDHVFRIWNLYKKERQIINKGYLSIIKTLMKLNDIEEAGKIFSEWESKGVSYDFRIADFLIDAYCRRGEIRKAEDILNRGIAKGGRPKSDSWLFLAGAYVKDNQLQKMVEALENANSVCSVDWKSTKDMLVNCLEIFGRQGDVQRAETVELIELLKVEGFFSEKVRDKARNLINDDNHSPNHKETKG